MALTDQKITDGDISAYGVAAAPDQLSGTIAENKRVFDRLIRDSIKQKFNALIDALRANTAAAELGAVNAAGDATNVNAYLQALERAGVGAGNVPAGGAAGKALVKGSAADYDTQWYTLREPYRHIFAAADWTAPIASGDPYTLSVPAAVHGIATLAGCNFRALAGGAYRVNVWAVIGAWATQDVSTGDVTLHSAGAFDGDVLLFS